MVTAAHGKALGEMALDTEGGGPTAGPSGLQTGSSIPAATQQLHSRRGRPFRSLPQRSSWLWTGHDGTP